MEPEFLNSLKEINITIPRTSYLNETEKDKVLQTFMAETGLDKPQTITAIAVLFQQGGTARSCDGNLSTTVFEKTIKLAQIRKALKTNNLAKGERKLARSLGTDIFKVSEVLQLPGNLAKKISRLNPDSTFTPSEQCWLSEFQAYNADCPLALRKLILSALKTPAVTQPKKKKSGK